MSGNRLFLALVPDEQTRRLMHAAAKDLAIRMQPQGKREIPHENYHVTLQFLGGNISDEQTIAVMKAAGQIRGKPIQLRIDVAQAFPATSVWWIGPTNAPPELADLRADAVRWMAEVGIKSDKQKYVPHVSVLHTKTKLPPTRIAPIAWRAHKFELLESRPGPTGSQYRTVGSWPLTGEEPRRFQDGRDAEQMSLI